MGSARMIENIKQEIGRRITLIRKDKLGITIKELASRTNGLSAQRISNWEQGTRSPGPMEAKQLADVLNISASYLLCLTDSPNGELHQSDNDNQYLLPLLTFDKAHLAKDLITDSKDLMTILVDTKTNAKVNQACFALKVEDLSMQPIFEEQDLLIISTELKPQPGQYVVAYITKSKQSVLRRYSESDSCLFQLHPTNDMWATTNVKKAGEVVIIGTVIEHRRYY